MKIIPNGLVDNFKIVKSDFNENHGWIIVSGYTPKSPYEVEKKEFIESMVRNNIPHVVFESNDCGDWLHNSRSMNEIILYSLSKFKDKNIVWVDCDARFLKYPRLFNGYKYDIGLFIPIIKKENRSWREFMTGTLFFANKKKVRNWWRGYVEFILKENYDFSCQSILGAKLLESNLSIDMNFPKAYCYIADPVPAHGAMNLSDVIILHRRGMKRYRGIVNDR